MQLSKRDFQKLSVKERAHLVSVASQKNQQKRTNKPQLKGGVSKPRRSPMTGGRGQASVAAAYASPAVGRAPQIKATRDTCNIQHRELISNIQGTVGFTVGQALAVNPGISSTFPWLSIMAQGWEEYKFRSLRFCYKTRTGSNTPGSVMMAPDYDAADGVPATEQIMSSYAQAIEDAPWKDVTCVLKVSNMNQGKRHYVRSGPLAANLDIKSYDICNLFVGTVDGTAIPWGKLWVEYDIDFFIPQLPSSGAVIVSGGSLGGSFAGMTAANPLGTAPTVDPQAVGISADATSLVTISTPGTYLATFGISGTVITGLGLAGVSNAVVTALVGPLISGAVTAGTWYRIVTSAPNATVQATATATSVNSSTLSIASAPPGSLL